MEPSATAIFTWAASKVVQLLGGLIGGLAMAAYWLPERFKEKGKVASVFIAGGVSMAAALIGGGIAAHTLGISPKDFEISFLISMVVGLFGSAIFNWVSNYIEKRQHWDIGQVAKDVRQHRQEIFTSQPKPRPKRKEPKE
jgi:MFS family permease